MRISILMLLAALAPAQTPAPSTPDQNKAHIEGTLYNKVTGQPLRKATVSLHDAAVTPQRGQPPPPAAYAAVTDAEGKFVFDDIDPGRYRLAADRAGYIHATYHPASGALLTVGPGQSLKDIRFPITPQGVIAGRVVDEDGDPLTEIGISAYEWRVIRGVPRFSYARQAMADDQGNFRIANLEAGRYVISAQLWQNQPAITAKMYETYVTTFYPSAFDLADATQIPLAAGAEATNVEIRMHKTRVFHIRGKIVDAAGSPIQANMALSLGKTGDSNAEVFGTVAITRAGAFDFVDVRPGSYYISTANNVLFSTDQNAPSINKKLFARYAVTIGDRDVSDVSIALHTGAVLTGTISTDGASDPPAQAANKSNPSFPSIALQPVDNLNSGGASAQAKADGTFEIRDLAPERFRIDVTGTPEGTYIKSIRMGSEDITHGILDLSEGSGGAIDIKVSPNGATVSGTVQNANGDAMGDVLVTLGPESAEVSTQTLYLRRTRTDQDGHFTIKSLPPGEYRLLAWEEVDDQLITSPEFRARFDSNSVTVNLSENAKVTSDLKLIPRETIEAEAAKL